MTTERGDSAEQQRFGETGELVALEQRVRQASAVIGKVLTDQWGLPPDAVVGFLDDTYRHWKSFWRSVSRPEQWAMKRIVKLAGEYIERRGVEPPDGAEEPPNIVDVVRSEAALNTLPERARDALVLFMERHSYEEIAKQLNVSTVYAKKLVTRAVNQLRAWRPQKAQ